MTFPMPHPACFSTVSPESEAADRAYEAYLASFPIPVAKAMSAAYQSYSGRSRRDISNQQIADELSVLEINYMISHQAKIDRQAAKEAQVQHAMEAKELKAQQRATILANAAKLNPTKTAVFAGHHIKTLRTEAGFSQGELAGILGVTTGTISHYELGLTPIPPARIETLAALFGKTVKDFIGGTNA